MVTVTQHEHCIRIVASVLYQSANFEWERARELAGPAVEAIERAYGIDASVASREPSSDHPRPRP
jgi:hypothetical protein